MKFILSIIVLYILIAILLMLFQRSQTYYPNHERPTISQWHANDMQEVTLKTSDGLSLFAWYKAPQAGKPTLVYFHGNAGHIGHRVFLTTRYRQAGFGLLLVEYRGYAGNPGKPTEKGLYQDAHAAMAFLKKQNIPPQCTVLVGESLGTAVAIEIATHSPVAALILQSPFTSLADIASHHYFFLPVRWFLWERYDSLKKIKTLHIPLLITYAENDKIVPPKFSKTLFEAANEPKVIIGVPNTGHNDYYLEFEYPKILKFIETYAEPKCRGEK